MRKKKPATQERVPAEVIERRILLIRGHKVMLDRDLAALYEVKPSALRQAVKRNANHFPPDFVLHLSEEEAAWLVSQNVIPRHAFERPAERPRGYRERGHHAHVRPPA